MDTRKSFPQKALRGGLTAGAGLLLLVVGEQTSHAQYEACVDTINLRAPTGLLVEYELEPVTGNRILWDLQAASETSCFRVEVPAQTRARFDPVFTGSYLDVFDREVAFAVPVGSGVVGDQTADVLSVTLDGLAAFEAVPSLAGRFNVSNRGGLFRVDIQANRAEQANGPTNEMPSAANRIPPHLDTTDVTAVTTWENADGSQTRIYASVRGLPLVRSDDGARTWRETAAGGFDPIERRVDELAVSPSDPDRVFLGTANRGLWRTLDGGVTFERADDDITTANPAITALEYLRVDDGTGTLIDRLFMAASGLGLFYSDDEGETWIRITELRPPKRLGGLFCDRDGIERDSTAAALRVRAVAVSPSNPSRVYAGLVTWGVYRSDDSGINWERANEGLVLCFDVHPPEGRPVDIDELLVLRQQEAGEDLIFATTAFDGAFLSGNGGDSWVNVDWPWVDFDPPEGEEIAYARATELAQSPFDNAVLYATTETLGLLESTNRGQSWFPWDSPEPILTDRLASMAFVPGSSAEDEGVLLVGSVGGGVYLPGTDIEISRSTTGTLPPPPGSVEPLNLFVDLGLSLRLSEGPIDSTDFFTLFGQNIQGYAVWRARDLDRTTGEPEWVLIGLYDLTNPEFCFASACDEPNPQHITGCFADKRANCFGYNEERDKIYFFDREVQNGFTYQYAVSSFDYGYMGDTSPTSFAGEMMFSPRSAVESSPQATPFTGATAREADLELWQSVTDITPQVGKQVDVVLTLRNRGPENAGDVRVKIVSPPGLVFDVGAAEGRGQYDGAFWSLNYVASGTEAQITIPATYDTDGTVLSEAVIVLSDQPDPDPSNDAANVRMVAERADMALAQRVDAATQFVGQPVTMRVDVTNNGPDVLTGARILVAEPAGLRFDSVSASSNRYSDGIWRPTSIQVGETRTMTIQAVVLRGGSISATATALHASEADSETENDRSSVQLTGENYNTVEFQVNVETAGSLENVYVVPNPLRGQAGWDFDEAASVRFVNVTPGSTCEIYTLAGDLVRTLQNRVTEGEERGNIQWDTKNENGNDVASGVYIYRVFDQNGGEVIDRLTIIR